MVDSGYGVWNCDSPLKLKTGMSMKDNLLAAANASAWNAQKKSCMWKIRAWGSFNTYRGRLAIETLWRYYAY